MGVIDRKSPDDVHRFLKEIVRYHILDWVDQLQHDRYGIAWDYRTGMKSSVLPANAPPGFIEYPSNNVIKNLSTTPLGTVKELMTYWKERTTNFRVPSGSTLQFITSPENDADAYRIQISNPAVFTLTLSVLQGATLLNYGFAPQQFEFTSETIKHTRSFNIVVKGRLELRRFADGDPQLQEQYVKWAEGLLADLRKSIEPPTETVTPQSPPEAKSSASHPPIPATDALFMDCEMGLMPSIVKSDERIHVLLTSEIPGSGLADYFSLWLWERT